MSLKIYDRPNGTPLTGEYDEATCELSLRGETLDNQDIIAVCHFLETKPYIKALDVRCCHLMDNEVCLLASIESIEKLNVCFNLIGPESAKALAANNTIRVLDISNTIIGSKGAAYLATNKVITDLNVRHTGIGCEGAAALAQNTTIEKLNASLNKIGNKGAEALAANKTMKCIDLTSNQIDDNGYRFFSANTTFENIKTLTASEISEKLLEQTVERNKQLKKDNLEVMRISKFLFFEQQKSHLAKQKNRPVPAQLFALPKELLVKIASQVAIVKNAEESYQDARKYFYE